MVTNLFHVQCLKFHISIKKKANSTMEEMCISRQWFLVCGLMNKWHLTYMNHTFIIAAIKAKGNDWGWIFTYTLCFCENLGMRKFTCDFLLVMMVVQMLVTGDMPFLILCLAFDNFHELWYVGQFYVKCTSLSHLGKQIFN